MTQNNGLAKIPAIAGAKFILIMLIVLIHSSYVGNVDASLIPPVADAVIWFFRSGLTLGALYAFFILAGFLFFRGMDGLPFRPMARICVSKMHRRIHTLLIPYLLWNLIAAAVDWLKFRYMDYPGHGVFTPGGIDLPNFLLGFISLEGGGPYNLVMWFVRNLLIFSLLSPLLYYVSRSRIFVAAVVGVCTAVGTNLYGAEYFIIGGCLGMYDPNLSFISSRSVRAISAAVWLASAIALAFLPENGLTTRCVELMRNLSIVPVVLYLGGLFPGKTRAGHLMLSSTFFVYAAHGLCCTLVRKSVAQAIGYTTTASALCSYFATFFLLSGGLILLFYLMKRLAPGLTSLLSGGR